MPGPPKTPTHLQLVRGNPSKRAVNKNEPKPPSGVPTTPKHFSKQEKYWFKRLGDELDCMGVITKLDGMALELLIGAYIEWRTHRDYLDEEGETYTTKTQTGDTLIKAHPRVAMMADAWKRLRGMMSEFGMTPASRSKVNTGGTGEVDPFDEFLKARE
ncbi:MULTISPECIES: phage terminase small subunit P27 family [Pantoea]|uniref:phage terminase small subunit P27 family n=1 Tax=Pantoea TaxID=53335 RepID=UPI000A25E913|nr:MULTISPECIES: phage terminase small subunit P27 family [Pantoea]MBW1251963.1 phage terminase small subunit P27 family [Pantoea allii]MBW1260560.1 phage terminase small subunit P27 family [Pantoea allii]MBW1283157.1 phage terminase small subunit P27 family [Pantoea allii]MCS3405424.1 phage terminase small subunit P27 family [Pantoea sp. B566]ORM84818.1 terminase [Pantoea allii]